MHLSDAGQKILECKIPVSELYTNGVFFIQIRHKLLVEKVVQILKNCLSENFHPVKVVLVLCDVVLQQNQEFYIDIIYKATGLTVNILDQAIYRQEIMYLYSAIPKTIIGVTGSSGKSSVCYGLYRLLSAMFHKEVFLACSAGIGSKTLEPNSLSCLPFADIWQNLNQHSSCEFAVLEITSHGLKQERLYGISLDIGMILTIQEDHLDFHKTMDDYVWTKLSIINSIKNGGTLILGSLKESEALFSQVHRRWIQEKCREKSIEIVELNNRATSVRLPNPFEEQNLGFCVEVLKKLGFLLSTQELAALNLSDIFPPGRFEKVYEDTNKNLVVISDGAHNPDQIKNVLKLYQGIYMKIHIVYGVAGHRLEGDSSNASIIDSLLRPEDALFLTDDNPKNVASEVILLKLYNQCKKKQQINVIANRFTAIKNALKKKDLCVLVLGKSTEVTNTIELKFPKETGLALFEESGYLEFIERVDLCTISGQTLNQIINLLQKWKFSERKITYVGKKIEVFHIFLEIFDKENCLYFTIKYNEQHVIKILCNQK